ncbi:MAG: hypothetical protein LR015_11490, partial [Verrucomicrobia bacterium]|nr:hypothetical protein [Verrucomicrobiota bacterium]
ALIGSVGLLALWSGDNVPTWLMAHSFTLGCLLHSQFVHIGARGSVVCNRYGRTGAGSLFGTCSY